jgi:hypothetical protein
MYLTLEINRYQDDGCDLLAGSRIILRSHRLAGSLTCEIPASPRARLPQVDEEAERVMARHHACYGSPLAKTDLAAAHSSSAGFRRFRKARHSSESA